MGGGVSYMLSYDADSKVLPFNAHCSERGKPGRLRDVGAVSFLCFRGGIMS